MSAQPTNVLPFPGGLTLEQLTLAWIDAKRDEDAANARRLALETQICALAKPKEEGSTTIEIAGGFKLTLTGKLTYKVEDLDALREITRGWDHSLLKSRVELDETGCKWIRANAPELWGQVARVVTVKPAKTSVKVSV